MGMGCRANVLPLMLGVQYAVTASHSIKSPSLIERAAATGCRRSVCSRPFLVDFSLIRTQSFSIVVLSTVAFGVPGLTGMLLTAFVSLLELVEHALLLRGVQSR